MIMGDNQEMMAINSLNVGVKENKENSRKEMSTTAVAVELEVIGWQQYRSIKVVSFMLCSSSSFCSVWTAKVR